MSPLEIANDWAEAQRKPTPEQIAENRAKWVEWLRAGHPQGRGQLRSADGWCCLGGACEALGVEYDPDGGNLPREAMQKLGLTRDLPRVSESADGHDGFSWGLSTLNDTARATFAKIADIIEVQPITWNGYSETSEPVVLP